MPRVLRPQEKFRWNARAARYVDQRTGRFIPPAKVRDAIDKALDNASRRITRDTNALRAHRLGLGAWQDRMRENIRDVHLYSAAAAKGGWAQLTPSDYGHVGQNLRREYGHLTRFATKLEYGDIPLNGRALAYARMYAQAGRRTYHEVERDDRAAAGFTEERNELGSTESCAGCKSENRRGWVPIGDLAPIGGRECLSNCRCTFIYRRGLRED